MSLEQPSINLLVEGRVDEVVLKRLVQDAGLQLGNVYGGRGKEYLLANLGKYNQAARHGSFWVALVDLNNSAECAPLFIQKYLPQPAQHLCLRVAVRQIEAWLLADREKIADFLGVPISRIPLEPETLPDPKLTLISLARKNRKKHLREDIVPRLGSGAKVGPLYVSRVTEFVRNEWRPEVAAQQADSHEETDAREK
ncbi:MAG: hypothetical protein AB1896_20685 [Thermodesulfobacteriota bacterium]